ncbi:MAG TPA: MoaD/ThiS family protein [Sulfolobales archaeon]|nr:MoaD/ThiS family protein [Sulfolobales archaeon]
MRDLRIRLLGSLKIYSGKEELVLKIDGKVKLRDLLASLVRLEPSLSRAVEIDGKIKPGYLVFINDADYMVYQGLDTEVGDEDTITLMPISHGGSLCYMWRKR